MTARIRLLATIALSLSLPGVIDGASTQRTADDLDQAVAASIAKGVSSPGIRLELAEVDRPTPAAYVLCEFKDGTTIVTSFRHRTPAEVVAYFTGQSSTDCDAVQLPERASVCVRESLPELVRTHGAIVYIGTASKEDVALGRRPAARREARKSAGDTDPASFVSLVYPEKKTVPLVFERTAAAPAKATLQGTVRYEDGQARVSLSYSRMEPAILFGGDISAYVVWAVGKEMRPENLGELMVTKSGDSGSFAANTPCKDFAVVVTAEPYFLVSRPFDLVLFASGPTDSKKTSGTTFLFQDFRPGPIAGVTSIAGLKYDDKTPIPIKQAESAIKLIDRLHAGAVKPGAVQSATVALGEAKTAKNDKAIADASRRSISSSAEALREWARSREQLAAADAAARQAAKKASLEAKKAATSQRLSDVEAEKASVATERDLATQQRDQIARDREQIKADRDALAARLAGALGQVADTKSTARGTVTSLSGVLFDTGKSTLKPESKITLAKIAGVMLVFSKTTLQVEGYTDNVGTEETNLKLSESRAKAVRDFIESQGVASSRLSSIGKGPADPVADNATPDGRAKNRRVEIISSDPSL